MGVKRMQRAKLAAAYLLLALAAALGWLYSCLPDRVYLEPGQVNRMFARGLTYCGRENANHKRFYNDLMMLDASDLDRIVEWMSPTENICLGLFPRIAPHGVLSADVLHFIGEKFAQWRGNPSLAKLTNCREMSKVDRIALSIFRMKLAKPKVVVFRSLFVGTDSYMREMIAHVLSELMYHGTTVCVCTPIDYFDDFADRYIVWDKDRFYSNLCYEEAQKIVSGNKNAKGEFMCEKEELC